MFMNVQKKDESWIFLSSPLSLGMTNENVSRFVDVFFPFLRWLFL